MNKDAIKFALAEMKTGVSIKKIKRPAIHFRLPQ